MLTVRRNSLLYRALCNPVLHRQPDMWKAERSRWTYGLDSKGPRLTPLGVLHTLTGLSLNVKDHPR